MIWLPPERKLITPRASRNRQRGFLLNPHRFGGGGGGGDPHFEDVVVLMHFDGADGGTAFTDSSSYGKTFSIGAGSPTTSTASPAPLTGTASGLFNTAGIQCPLDSSLNLTGVDWTIEATAYITGGSGTNRNMAGKLSASNSDWQFVITSDNKFTMYLGDTGSGVRSSASAAPTGVKTQLAATMQGTTLRLFIDGSLDATHTGVVLADTGVTNTGQAKFSVGWLTGALTQYFPGLLDELRITKGVCRYTASYTPEAGPFPNF